MQNLIALSLAFASVTTAADLAGVVVKFEKPLGSATLAAELIEKFIHFPGKVLSLNSIDQLF